MELSKEDRDVLAHVVIDPDVWVIQAFEGFSHQWNKEKERLERLNELIEQGKQIDPQQKEYYENGCGKGLTSLVILRPSCFGTDLIRRLLKGAFFSIRYNGIKGGTKTFTTLYLYFSVNSLLAS